MTDHRHKATESREKAYSHSVNPWNEEPRAHGNICVVETCECGAERPININQGWEEVGHWKLPKESSNESNLNLSKKRIARRQLHRR